MLTDNYGNEIKAGDTIRFVVGIPGRNVTATVKRERGRLVVDDGTDTMSLSFVLKFFDCEVVGADAHARARREHLIGEMARESIELGLDD